MTEPTTQTRPLPDGGGLRIYKELEQGSDEWLRARCGLVTASVVGKLITAKTIKPAVNDYSRALIATLAAERITGHVVPIIPNRAMERGTLDEPYAREIYAENYAPVTGVVELGFMVRSLGDADLGFSPDGLVGVDGLIEIKSREPHIQLRTILEDAVPAENMAQIQAGMLVSGRSWCDYISYSGGMPLYVKRVLPEKRWFDAITEATLAAERAILMAVRDYGTKSAGLVPTERIDHFADIEF